MGWEYSCLPLKQLEAILNIAILTKYLETKGYGPVKCGSRAFMGNMTHNIATEHPVDKPITAH